MDLRDECSSSHAGRGDALALNGRRVVAVDPQIPARLSFGHRHGDDDGRHEPSEADAHQAQVNILGRLPSLRAVPPRAAHVIRNGDGADLDAKHGVNLAAGRNERAHQGPKPNAE